MEAIAKASILLSHSYPLVAAGISSFLSGCADWVLTQRTPRSGTLGAAPDPAFDVVVTDYRRGVCMAAATVAADVRDHQPKILVVTRHRREWEIRSAIEVGIDGYVYIGCGEGELVVAVRTLLGGHRYLCAASARRIASGMGHGEITAREFDVLRLIAEGFDNKAIAATLSLSIETVKTHVKTVLDKLGATSRTQAAALALRRGLALNAWQVIADTKARRAAGSVAVRATQERVPTA